MLHPPGFTQFFGDIRQWGKTINGSITWPISFTNTAYIATALKQGDHGGGIPNIIEYDKTKLTIEFEWMTYNGGTGLQETSAPNGVNIIAVGV